MQKFIDLIPFFFIYATLCWLILPSIHRKGWRILIAILLLYPAYLLESVSDTLYWHLLNFLSYIGRLVTIPSLPWV